MANPQPTTKSAAPPPTKPATAPPAPAPAPAPPAAPAPLTSGRPPLKALDEDLTEVAGRAQGRPAGRRKPPEEPAKPVAPEEPPGAVAAPTEPTAPAEPVQKAPPSDDDYLMGPVATLEKDVKGTVDDATTQDEPPATGPLKAPELRAEYARVKKRLAETEKELSELKSKSPPSKPVDETERKAYVEEIATLKKQLDETSGALKTVAYEHTDEYKRKYEQPFIDAWQEGVQLVSSLTVTDPEGGTRKGTADDFQALMREPNNEQAASLAQEMFGANAFYILAQRRDIQRLHNQRVKALDEYRATISEREKAQAETSKKQIEEREARRIQNSTLFKKFNADAAEKYPEFFAPVPGDDQGNAILARGYRDADLAFSGAEDLPDEKRVQLHSAIRNRAAAFGRLVHQLKVKDAQMAELRKELEEFKGSTPGGGQITRQEQTPKRLTADEEFELAASRRR